MANTNKGRKLYVCATDQPADLDLAGFEALTWVEVGNVGSVGPTGTNTNIVSYDELSTEVTQKQKGISNAGDPPIECARNASDPGQIVLRTAGQTKLYYAFKIEDDDAPSAGFTNSIYYNRGLVTGPVRPGGRNEDFILETFTLGLVQEEIINDPEALAVPGNVTRPSITGASVQTGVVLTAQEGTWTNSPTSFTYQWQHDAAGNGTYANVAAGGTSKTFTPVVADEGDSLRVQVTAHNAAGASAAANSLGTALQIAA